MKKVRNVLIVAVIVIAAGFAVYDTFFAKQNDVEAALFPEGGPKLKAAAPGFTLKGLDGNEYTVGGQRSKPMLLNFWASWCGPCELEAPDLVKMHDLYKEKLDIYAVNMTSTDRMDNLKSFVKHFGFEFPVLLDTEGKVMDLYRIRGLPISLLIDENGIIRDMFSVLPPEELEKRIKQVIS